jgi:hypothetical protein
MFLDWPSRCLVSAALVTCPAHTPTRPHACSLFLNWHFPICWWLRSLLCYLPWARSLRCVVVADKHAAPHSLLAAARLSSRLHVLVKDVSLVLIACMKNDPGAACCKQRACLLQAVRLRCQPIGLDATAAVAQACATKPGAASSALLRLRENHALLAGGGK